MPNLHYHPEAYPVEGLNLSEVKDKIFNLSIGKGFLSKDGQRRFAGRNEPFHICGWRPTFWNPGERIATIQVNFFDWHSTMRMPIWVDRQHASKEDRSEFQRFLYRLFDHEYGHVKIENYYMEQLRTVLLETPYGRFQKQIERLPRSDENGPLTETDERIYTEISQACESLYESHRLFQRVKERQGEYDTVTDHGKTQGATLGGV